MKRRSASLLAVAMMAASVPALAETMRIGDQAVVKKCKEYITLREADNVQATELARIPLGGQVIYLDPAKNGFARVEYGDTQGFVKTEYLGNQTARGTPFAITEEERRNVNLFLTNFTETGMKRYDAASTTDAELVRFAVLHAWLNRSGQWDVTEWGSRLEQDNVTDDVLRYFGRPLILLDQPDFDYDGAYYYMHEPGAPIGWASSAPARWKRSAAGCIGSTSAFTAQAKSSATTYMISCRSRPRSCTRTCRFRAAPRSARLDWAAGKDSGLKA